MKNSDHIELIFSDDHQLMAMDAFTRNAYPLRIHGLADTCRRRLALISINGVSLKNEVNASSSRFMAHLRKNKDTYIKTARRSPHPVVIYANDLATDSLLFSLLTTTKSFLDVYAMLISKSIDPHTSLKFNKGKVKGTDATLSGGHLVNWLENSTPSTYVNANALRNALLNHIKSWIHQLTTNRDQIVHESDLGILRMSIPIDKNKNHFSVTDLRLPYAPQGGLLSEYGEWVLKQVQKLIQDTILLLPNVSLEHLRVNEWKL